VTINLEAIKSRIETSKLVHENGEDKEQYNYVEAYNDSIDDMLMEIEAEETEAEHNSYWKFREKFPSPNIEFIPTNVVGFGDMFKDDSCELRFSSYVSHEDGNPVVVNCTIFLGNDDIDQYFFKSRKELEVLRDWITEVLGDDKE